MTSPRSPFPKQSKRKIAGPAMLSSAAVLGVGRQGSGFPVCAVLAGSAWNALGFRMYGLASAVPCPPFSLPRILLQLISSHYLRPKVPLPPPSSCCFYPPPIVRMQPFNPNPDNGNSARWSLFLVLHSHPPVSKRMQAISHPQTPSFK